MRKNAMTWAAYNKILSFPQTKIYEPNIFCRILKVKTINPPIVMRFSLEKVHFIINYHHFEFNIWKSEANSWLFPPNLSTGQVFH